MSQIINIIDDQRIFYFRIGYNIKVGDRYYQITGIEKYQHYETITAVSSGNTNTQSFNNNMKPNSGYLYWNQKMGIDGDLGFQLVFPRTPHWSVHGLDKFYYSDEAPRFEEGMLYAPFLVEPTFYPRIKFNNPEAASKSGIIYFAGKRFSVNQLMQPPSKYNELTEYAKGGIGEG